MPCPYRWSCGASVQVLRADGRSVARRRFVAVCDALLASPFAGIVPWVLMAFLSGPGRFRYAGPAALGLLLLVLVVSRRRGIRAHMVEFFGAGFFGAMTVVGLCATGAEARFLEMWAGEL